MLIASYITIILWICLIGFDLSQQKTGKHAAIELSKFILAVPFGWWIAVSLHAVLRHMLGT